MNAATQPTGGVVPLAALADKRFVPAENFSFATQLGWVAINDTEYHITAHQLPLTVRMIAGSPRLGALVDPDYLARPVVDGEGRWRAAYMMIALRTFPFVLLPREGGRPIDEIAVITAAGRIGDRGTPIASDPAKGVLGPELVVVHNTLRMMRQGTARLTRALDLLAVSNVFVPLRGPGGEPSRELTIDQERLMELEAGAVAALGSQSFLPLDLAAAILFSRRHIEVGRLPLTEVRTRRSSAAGGGQTSEMPVDPLDFVLANLGSMNFALDASELFDADDCLLIGEDFAPPPPPEAELRP